MSRQGDLSRADTEIGVFLAVMAVLLVASEASPWPRHSPWWDARMLFGLWLPLVVALPLSRGTNTLGLGPGNWKRGAMVIAVGVPLAVAAVIVLLQNPAAGQMYASQRGTALELVSAYAPPVLQVEVCFRALLLFVLARQLGPATAIAMSALLYGLVHLDKPFAEALGSIPVGIALAAAALWTRSVWYGFVVHLSGSVSLTLLAR